MRILFLRQGFKTGLVCVYRVTDGVTFSPTFNRLCDAYAELQKMKQRVIA